MITLKPHQYPQVQRLLDTLPTNTLLAHMILEGHTKGTVYADNANAPTVCLFLHSSGLNFLFGSNKNTTFNREMATDFLLKSHEGTKYLLVYPPQWEDTLSQLVSYPIISVDSSSASAQIPLPDQILRDSRLNFRFNTARKLETPVKPSSEYALYRVDRELFHKLQGTVLPNIYWKDFDTFNTFGAGFCLTKGIDIVSFSFCSSRKGSLFELGVETYPQYRSQGLAIHACTALVHYCLENGLNPIWGCRTTNLGSVALAKKLGFEITEELPYYRLMNSQELNQLLIST